jgi:hypothetical protein
LTHFSRRQPVKTAGAFLGLVIVALVATISAQDGRPLPDEAPFLTTARENLARSQREQYKYGYKERRSELHTNPFGRLGSGEGTSTWEVTPVVDGTAFTRRLVERDGKPVAGAAAERQERRARRGRSPLEDAAAVLAFSVDRREVRDGREMIVVRFEPKPDADPQTREGKIAKAFSGFIWVDEAAREVVRAEATAIDDISYGVFVARLHKGTTVTLVRERIDDRIWLPTSIQFTGRGRAMLFRRLNVDHAIEWFDYKRILD